MKRIKIEVKKKHIKSGQKLVPYLCPIAMAIKEHQDVCTVCVGNRGCTVWFYDKGIVLYPSRICVLSKRAQKFIKRFDKDKEVKPFKFFLRVL